VHRLRQFSLKPVHKAVSHLQRVAIPEAAYIQLRYRPEDEQVNARRVEEFNSINALYVNKQEFCASSWRSKPRLYYDARSTSHQDSPG